MSRLSHGAKATLWNVAKEKKGVGGFEGGKVQREGEREMIEKE